MSTDCDHDIEGLIQKFVRRLAACFRRVDSVAILQDPEREWIHLSRRRNPGTEDLEPSPALYPKKIFTDHTAGRVARTENQNA